jgi:hypothetical protein
MLLAPYTRSRDLLHLSTAARWLKPFRFHLESLRLRVPQQLCGRRDKVLQIATSLLGVQQRISRLRIEAGCLVVPALTAVKSGVSQGKTLQSLDIATVPCLTRKEYEGLSAALISGACPMLTVFQMHAKHLADEEVGCFVAAIRAGAFRQLRELLLETDRDTLLNERNSAGVSEMIGALEAGGCPMLTKLSLTCCCITPAGFAALARAVRGGSLSGLQAIKLDRCGLWGLLPGSAAGFVEALAEGVCPSLQALDLSCTSGVEEGDMLPLLTALGERRLRHLKSLTLSRVQVTSAGMVALSKAVLQGQRFEELSFNSSRYVWGQQDLLNEQDLLLLVCQRSPVSGGSARRDARLTPVSRCVQIESLQGGGGRLMKVLQFIRINILTDHTILTDLPEPAPTSPTCTWRGQGWGHWVPSASRTRSRPGRCRGLRSLASRSVESRSRGGRRWRRR